MIRGQRIIIRGQIFRNPHPGDRLVKHATKRSPIDIPAVDAKADDAPSALVHHNQHPMRFQCDGFATKQVRAPQTAFRMADKREPRRPAIAGSRPIVLGEDTPHHILVDFDSKRLCALFGSPRTSVPGIPALHLNDALDAPLRWAFGSWLAASSR